MRGYEREKEKCAPPTSSNHDWLGRSLASSSSFHGSSPVHTSEADRLEREVTLSERGHAARTDRHAGYVRIQENSAGYRALVQVGDIVCCVFVTARPVKCSASPASFFCSSSSTLRSVPCSFFFLLPRARATFFFSLLFFFSSLSFSSFSRAYRQSREYISASLEIVATTTAATTPSTITTTTTTNANSERVSVPDVSVSRLPLSFFFFSSPCRSCVTTGAADNFAIRKGGDNS